MSIGKVYLIGAGPGRPDLITLRGLNILKEAEVIIYDYLVDGRILEYAKENAELICCDKLAKKGRYSDGFLIHQEKITELLVKKVKEGRKVIRLKNGDPSIFSRCSEELNALLKHKIDFEIVPGVTAASAASSYSGIPLTDRGLASSCIFVTGHESPLKKKSSLDWQAIARIGTVVLYMAVDNLADIVKQMLKFGRDKNTAISIVEGATLERQKILTAELGDVVQKAKKKKIKPPAIIIIGEVVRLGKRFNWLKKNKKILFTGLSKERFFAKGNYFHLPLIKIKPMDDYTEFDDYLRNINSFHWIVFSSRYGVEYFFKRLNAAGLDSRSLRGIKIAAVGNSTKNRLLDFGIVADLVPKKESSEGLISAFKKILSRTPHTAHRTPRIFLPRSDLADKGLTNGLSRLGAEVVSGFAYKNVIAEHLPPLDFPAKAGFRQRQGDSFDEIMFTSPSTVRNFKKRYKRVPKGVKISCIGDVTLKEAEKQLMVDS